MFDIRDHGGHFKGSSSSPADKPFEISTLASITNASGQYLQYKSVNINYILRSKNERDLFIFLSNNEILKYDSTDDTFGYYCNVTELNSLSTYMYNKYLAFRKAHYFTRLNDNIIISTPLNTNAITVYDTNYNELSSLTIGWSSGYLTYSAYLTVNAEGENIIILNGRNTSNLFDKPWIISNDGFTHVLMQGATTYTEHAPIMNTNFTYCLETNNQNAVRIFDYEESEWIASSINISYNSLIQYLPGYFFNMNYNNNLYNHRFFMFDNNTIKTDNDAKPLLEAMSTTGLETNLTAQSLILHSIYLKKFFKPVSKVIPFIELKGRNNDFSFTFFDKNSNAVVRKIVAMPYTTGSALYIKPDDFFVNNVENGSNIPIVFTAKTNGYLSTLHLLSLKPNY